MLDECKSFDERWAGVEALLKRWLDERQQLIVTFYRCAGVNPGSAVSHPQAELLAPLCNILVDYCSAGHFEVYTELLREAQECHDGSTQTGVRLIEQIQDSTEFILDFNDRYAEEDTVSQQALHTVLGELGNRLSERFELEDQLIQQLHTAHAAAMPA